MKKQTFTRVLAMALCVLMLFLAGCGAAPEKAQTNSADSEAKYKDTITIYGGSANMVSYDYDGSPFARALLMTHDRLIEKDLASGNAMQFVPGLATEWEWVDENVLEMKLREGVKFHNGEVFTADDVLFTFNDCVLTHSQASKISMLDHVEQVDDYTVRFVLKQFHADFLTILSEGYCSIVNRKAVEADEIEGAFIGTGPYYIQKFVQSDYEEVERFDDYWGEKPLTRHFILRNVPETSTAMIALENGEMDAITFDVVDMPYIEENDELEAHVVPNLNLNLNFNTSKGPGSDKNLRLAVAYCFNMDDLLASVDPGYSAPLYTAWGPNTLGYDESIGAYGRDLEKAKEYLEKSKYKEFTITCNNSIAYVAEIIQANCAEIGLKVNIEPLEGAAVTAKTKYDVAEHDALIASLAWNPYGDDCRRPYYPGSNTNKAVINNDRITELVDLAACEHDEAKRVEYYHEIQRINHDECYILPLCLAAETTAYNVNLQNFFFDPRGRHDFSHAYMLEK